VTVLVTTCLTVTLPGLPLASVSTSRGEKDALHGAALSGVDEYDDLVADGMPAENGDCGMWSLRGVRDERGAGTANDDGGMVTRGDSGRDLLRLEAVFEDTADCALLAEAVEVVES